MSLPSYATITPSGALYATWTSNSSDPRALQNPTGTGRSLNYWYSQTSFTVNVDLTDGQLHELALYFSDWGQKGRSERVQISNATTGTLLDSTTVSSFASSGVYVLWTVSGDVTITITTVAGPNAVLSGLFLDPAPATTAAVINRTTEGSWIGTFGAQGYDIIGDTSNLPSYATITPSGAASFTAAASTTVLQALQETGGTSRIAASWYASKSFTVDVNLTDGQTHQLALYFLDWSNSGRIEQVQISNATTGALLNTVTISSFSSGDMQNGTSAGTS